jgi:sugar lactone lactonase YvrE
MPSKGTNKNIARILVAIVAVLVIYELMGSFHSEPLKFKVQKLLKVQGDESPAGSFVPWGIAPIGKDKVAVADVSHNRILVFDRQGKFFKEWGKRSKGSKADEFHEPSGMVADDKGNIYVIDTWNAAIKGYDENGKSILGIDLNKFQSFFGPRGLGFDGHNFLVADTGGHRVVQIGMDGTLGVSWGKQGTGSGEFKGPLAVAADSNGNYYVADTDNNRLQRLDREGKNTKTIKCGAPVSSVAVDKQGRFYVGSGADGGTIKAYSPSGKYLGDLVDEAGSGDAFRGPRSMWVASDNVLMFSVGTVFYLFQLPSEKP